MTDEERRTAERAAEDLEQRALELPAESEARQGLLQTARVYRHVAHARVDFGWRVEPTQAAQQ